MTQRSFIRFITFLTLFLVGGCAEDTETTSGCIPGETRQCDCEAIQVCKDDGTNFTSCDCADSSEETTEGEDTAEGTEDNDPQMDVTEEEVEGTPEEEGGETPEEEGGEAPQEEGGETPEEEGGEAPQEEGGEAPQEEGGETPEEEGGEATAEEGGEATAEEGGEAIEEEGGEAPEEEGGETPAEEGGEATAEEGGEATAEEGGEVTEEGGEPSTAFGDPSGTFFFALQSGLNPNLPFQFVATNTFTANEDGSGILNMKLQSLTLDVNSTDVPRELKEFATKQKDIFVNSSGEFEVDLGLFIISQDANPLSSDSVTAEQVLTGKVVDGDFLCGTTEGSYSVGFLEVPLDTSSPPTFAATRIEDPLGPYPLFGEDMVLGCPEETGEVVLDKPIRMELTWNTPNDPDQTDEGPEAGADVDLHFMHPLAKSPGSNSIDFDEDGEKDGWFDQAFDCFWFSFNPDWGPTNPLNPGEAANDPTVVQDDTDGMGPEIIELLEPEGDTTYSVGVHYWNDNGYGPSYATVRIYIDGALIYEKEDVKMEKSDFWEAATVNVSTMEVMPIGDGAAVIDGYMHPDFESP